MMMTDHEWARETLPWLVNGTLGEAEARRLRAHLDSCDDCRKELQFEEQLARAVAARPAVDYAPQASLAKLMQRIERSERSVLRRWLPKRGAAGETRRRRTVWALVGAQAAAVVVLALALAWQAWKPEPHYVLTGTPAPSLPHLQVIFDDETSAADILTIVAKVKGRVIGGPSSAGVYLIAVDGGGDAAQSAAQALQNHPHVRFIAVVQAPPGR